MDCGCVIHREKLESRDLLAPVVSADLLDPWDPLDWLEPLESLDVRYDETIALENNKAICLSFCILVSISQPSRVVSFS